MKQGIDNSKGNNKLERVVFSSDLEGEKSVDKKREMSDSVRAIFASSADASLPDQGASGGGNANVGLHEAILGADWSLVRRLLLNPNVNLLAKNNEGYNALHLLVMMGGANDIAEELLSSGIEINDQDRQGNTALHISLAFGHLKITEFLLGYPDIKVNISSYDKGQFGEDVTAIELAVLSKYNRIVELLLAKGAKISEQLNQFILNNRADYKEIVDIIERQKLSDSRAQSNLRGAAEEEIVEANEVNQKIAEGFDKKSKKKSSAKKKAQVNNNSRSQKSDKDEDIITFKELHDSINGVKGSRDFFELQLNSDIRSIVNTKGEGGNTALHFAMQRLLKQQSENGKRETLGIIDLLLAAGASKKIKNDNGASPIAIVMDDKEKHHLFKIALEDSRLLVQEILVNNFQVKINLCDDSKETLLHNYAIKEKQILLAGYFN